MKSKHDYVKRIVNFEPEDYKVLRIECNVKGCNLQWLLRQIIAQWKQLRDKATVGL